ncbi:hypothetical protein [Streptomyces sp.]|uniref:hypothetical protein n=1 Tax=Streptomyces sp. TaxID=1931 RepID=UPI002F3FDD1F
MREQLTPRPGTAPPFVVRRSAAQARRPLAAVCIGFTLAQLVLVVPGTGLGWDETVYTSQVSGFVPAAFFSAPRARGITFLAAPVAGLTSSVLALRIWLALLSGAGLYLALRCWQVPGPAGRIAAYRPATPPELRPGARPGSPTASRATGAATRRRTGCWAKFRDRGADPPRSAGPALVPAGVLALAGALFATLWITVFYGPQVMPNLWSAYGALAAVGCFLRAGRDRGDRAALAGLAAGVAVVALMRPPDAVWLALPLAGATAVVRRWRRPALFAALAAGLLLGGAEWVIEAYANFGGLSARITRGSEIQGGMGWHVAVDDQIRSLDGRGLCRPCDVPWRHKVTSVWWFALPVLAVGGALVAARVRDRATAVLPLLVAGFLAYPYLFTIDYAAPRFLLPAYALLALPVAECLWWLVSGPAGRPRPVLAAVVAVALCGHLAVQYGVLANIVGNNHALSTEYGAVAARLHGAGVRPPCLVSGDRAVPIAFYAGCASRQTSGPDSSITPAGVLAAARVQPVAVIVPPHQRPPSYARAWRPLRLPDGASVQGYRAYLPPPTAAGWP